MFQIRSNKGAVQGLQGKLSSAKNERKRMLFDVNGEFFAPVSRIEFDIKWNCFCSALSVLAFMGQSCESHASFMTILCY